MDKKIERFAEDWGVSKISNETQFHKLMLNFNTYKFYAIFNLILFIVFYIMFWVK